MNNLNGRVDTHFVCTSIIIIAIQFAAFCELSTMIKKTEAFLIGSFNSFFHSLAAFAAYLTVICIFLALLKIQL